MVAPPIQVQSDRLLLVEGTSDRDFFRALLDSHDRAAVQVESYGGKTNLRSRLRIWTAQADFQERCKWLGVARDADDSVEDAFRSITDSLRHAGQPVPDRVDVEASDEVRRVRVLVIPSGGGKELEDLIWESIRTTHPRDATCVESFFNCLVRANPGVNRSGKALVYAHLSTFDPPDRSVGAAALAMDGSISFASASIQEILDLIPHDDEVL